MLFLHISAVNALGFGDPTCWSPEVTPEMCCDLKEGPRGNAACWEGPYTYERCCLKPKVTRAAPLECIEQDVVLRHAGEHAIFQDLSIYGHAGCFQNDCKLTDKFNTEHWSVCARACAETEECTHWSFGEQGEPPVEKCFLRKSDGGREQSVGWLSGSKACGPPGLPKAFTALSVAESRELVACDGGKDPEKCPDVEKAVNTWNYALRRMQMAIRGRVDQGTGDTINQITEDSINFQAALHGEYRPSDHDYPRIVYNNRLIFNQLRSFLVQFPTADLSESDVSLPNPLRFGMLCGRSSCYET